MRYTAGEWREFDDPDFLGVIVRDLPDLAAPARLCFVQKHTLVKLIRETVKADIDAFVSSLIAGGR